MDKDNNKILDLLYEEKISETSFVVLLLGYLSRRGIKSINKEELSKKLFSYYNDEKYKILFQNISKDRYENKVNISEGLGIIQYFCGLVYSKLSQSNILYLNYGEDYNISQDEKWILDKNIIVLLNELADELSIQMSIENQIFSTKKPVLIIYKFNPNTNYSILYGKKSAIYESELITDGNLSNINTSNLQKHIAYKDPTGEFLGQSYNSGIISNVLIKDASYTIIKGKENDIIKRIEVFTKILELEKLKIIREIANKEHLDEQSLLNNNKPYVRKKIIEI